MGKVFVGRAEELRALDEALAEARAGRGQFVVVSGEPGVGKTRLAEELAHRAEAEGCTVAWGRSWEAEGTPAYWPWTSALRAVLKTEPGRSLVQAAVAETPELEVLSVRPRLRVTDGDAEASRFVLFEGVSTLLARLSEERPLLLVLDDLHAADTATLHLLAFVTRELRGAKILLLGLARDVPIAGSRAQSLLAASTREALQIPLARLDREAVGRWLSVASPTLASAADRLFAVSEGNPLFVGELLASARKRGAASWTSTSEMPLGIREVIRAHIASLSEPAQRLAEAAAVLGRDLAMSDLLALANEPGARALLDELSTSGVLSDGGDGQLRFVHVLVRDELYARIDAVRRVELHRAAARQASRTLAERAHHLVAGAEGSSAREAVDAVLAASRDAIATLAFEDAALLAERALQTLGGVLDRAAACDLRMAIGRARWLAGSETQGREASARAAEIAAELGDGERLARAALAFAHEPMLSRHESTVRLLRRANGALDRADSALRCELQACLAVAMIPAPPEEVEEAHHLARDAIAMARRLGDDAALFAALRQLSGYLEALDGSERTSDVTIALARRLGQLPRVAHLFGNTISNRLDDGDLAGARRFADDADEVYAMFRQPSARWRAPMIRAFLASLEGRFADADALGRESLAICEESGVMEGVLHFCAHRVSLAAIRGDAEVLLEHEAMIRKLMSTPSAAPFLSFVDALVGNVAAARAALEHVRTLNVHGLPGAFTLGWTVVHAGLTEHAEFFHDLLVRRPRAAHLLGGPSGLSTMGPGALLRGQLESMMGRDEDAVASFREALAYAQRIEAKPFVAQIELAWAEHAAGVDRREEARAHAALALPIAQQLVMRAVSERARKILDASPASAESVRPVPSAPTAHTAPTLTMTREGELWTLEVGATHLALRDARGLPFLDTLLKAPHREVHVLELVGSEDTGDAGPMLDDKAKRAYRERAEDLRDRIDEYTQLGDLGRVERARAELDALAGELARGLGLGGKSRRAGSPTERARINVQRRLKDVIRRVAEQSNELGRHLELSVKTGVFCMYAPTWPEPPA